MSSLNIVFLMGRVGTDISFQTQNGTGVPVANFTLATNDYVRETGATKTEWHPVVCYGKTADTAKNYLRKGSLVHITGRIQANKVKGQQGEQSVGYDIIVNSLILFPNKEASQVAPQGAVQEQQKNWPPQGWPAQKAPQQPQAYPEQAFYQPNQQPSTSLQAQADFGSNESADIPF